MKNIMAAIGCGLLVLTSAIYANEPKEKRQETFEYWEKIAGGNKDKVFSESRKNAQRIVNLLSEPCTSECKKLTRWWKQKIEDAKKTCAYEKAERVKNPKGEKRLDLAVDTLALVELLCEESTK